jgi:hypothetical protein
MEPQRKHDQPPSSYYRLKRGILIVPHDYGPLWVYKVSKEEQARLADTIERIKTELSR